jgi:hypothetical protein
MQLYINTSSAPQLSSLTPHLPLEGTKRILQSPDAFARRTLLKIHPGLRDGAILSARQKIRKKTLIR